MSKIDDAVTEIHDNNDSLAAMAKDRAFDLIAVGLIFAVGLLSLGAIGLRELTWLEAANMVLEAVPFYLATVTLSVNFYKKGTFTAKNSQSFINVITNYSNKVNKLTGKQLDNLSDFCAEYNDKALITAQKTLLRSVSISYEHYHDGYIDENGNRHKPFKQMSYKDIEKVHGKRVASYITKANEVEIKGLNANTLLGNNDDWDITNLGPDEQQLLKKRTRSYAGGNLLSIFLLTLMSVKDITEWGWIGFILIVFKLLFILCRCYMEYFKGRDDITQRVSNHLSRKTDILKQFDYWYFEQYPEEIDTTDPDFAWLSNLLNKSLIYYNNDGCKTGDDGTSPKNVEGVLNGQ